MRFKVLFMVLLVLVSCKKKEQYEDVQLIGHAGAGLDSGTSPYHDNSKEAIDYAVNMEGIDGVEIDLQCSASGSIWLFHNTTLDDATNGEGCINSVTDDYLNGLSYSGLGNEALLKFADLDFPFASKTCFLDIRHYNSCTGQITDQQTMIDAIEAAVPGSFMTEVSVITNNPNWVHAFYLKGWNVYFERASANDYLDSWQMTETVGLCIRNSEIDRQGVKSVHEAGKEVVIFEVRSPKGIRSGLKKHPDYLITDNLKAAIIEKYP
ncbi:MAG TPA: glycerophosphodiester phosphodiesterase family protein [Fluviicola sp.]|nr:glycerophosphodiester phosphodiesterase family protein [Fluviicola sp.]